MAQFVFRFPFFFWLRDFDLWHWREMWRLCKILFWMTRTTVDAADSNPFASKYAGEKHYRITRYFFLLRDFGQWPLCKIVFWLIQVTVNAIAFRLFAKKSLGKNERVLKLRFFVFRSLTLTCNRWVKFSFGWRELRWRRLIWDLLRANRSVIGKIWEVIRYLFSISCSCTLTNDGSGSNLILDDAS